MTGGFVLKLDAFCCIQSRARCRLWSVSFACRRRYPAFSGKTKDSVRYEVFRRDRIA